MVIRSQNEVRRMKNEERAAGYDDQSFMYCVAISPKILPVSVELEGIRM